jgi:hypothetical protein
MLVSIFFVVLTLSKERNMKVMKLSMVALVASLVFCCTSIC